MVFQWFSHVFAMFPMEKAPYVREIGGFGADFPAEVAQEKLPASFCKKFTTTCNGETWLSTPGGSRLAWNWLET